MNNVENNLSGKPETKHKPCNGKYFSKKNKSQFNEACNTAEKSGNSETTTNFKVKSQPNLTPTPMLSALTKTPPNTRPKPTRKTIANSLNASFTDVYNNINSPLNSPPTTKTDPAELTSIEKVFTKLQTSNKKNSIQSPPSVEQKSPSDPSTSCNATIPSTITDDTPSTDHSSSPNLESHSLVDTLHLTSATRNRAIRQHSCNYEKACQALRRNSKSTHSYTHSSTKPLSPPPADTGIVASRIARLTAMFEPVVVHSVTRTRSTPASTPCYESKSVASIEKKSEPCTRPRRPISLISSESTTCSSTNGELELLSPSALTCSDVPLITVRRRVEVITSSSPTCTDSFASMHHRFSTNAEVEAAANATITASPAAIIIESTPNPVKSRIAAFEKLINGC